MQRSVLSSHLSSAPSHLSTSATEKYYFSIGLQESLYSVTLKS